MRKMAIVLAAGQGKRMKSKLYKVLHPVCGKPMIGHVICGLERIGMDRTVVVVGHGAEAVQTYLGSKTEYALQAEQLGTGHAVMQAQPLLENEEGITLVLYGDTPLIKDQTIERLLETHTRTGAAVTMLTADFVNPHGYGRIIRESGGAVEKIVEQKDCTPAEQAVTEINTGTYCFDNRKLFRALSKVTNDNAQNEYYLTDVIGIMKQEGERIEAFCTDDPGEAVGVNDRVGLAEAEQLLRERINRGHLLNGVSLIDPANIYIEADVKIGIDTIVHPGCMLRGRTVIGEDCVIGPASEIEDSEIGNGVHIHRSVVVKSFIRHHSSVGPFAYLRPGAQIGENVKIGDFVEVKNAVVGDNSKVSHLSYVGDARVGKNVNIGCGAITVNYDGFNKHITEIEDEAFIGSNVNLIAPVKIGQGAYVVAGSTITQDVGDNDLAIARERQSNKEGYAEKIRNRFKMQKKDRPIL